MAPLTIPGTPIEKGRRKWSKSGFFVNFKGYLSLPPLYILLSGELTRLQPLAGPVPRGVKPASSRPIKLQQGTRTRRCGRERPGCPLNDFPDTPAGRAGAGGRWELCLFGRVSGSAPPKKRSPKLLPLAPGGAAGKRVSEPPTETWVPRTSPLELRPPGRGKQTEAPSTPTCDNPREKKRSNHVKSHGGVL